MKQMVSEAAIFEIAILNKECLTAKHNIDYMNYLDTSSLTQNKISRLVFLKNNYPIRAKRIVQEYTILYSTVRPEQEHFGIIERKKIDIENLIVSTGFITIDVISNSVNSKYLFYKLTQRHITKHLQAIAENSVSSYPSIKPSDISNLKFLFPDLSTQQKIAAVLSALDDKIELNNKINAELEQMAKTLYDYWFVQFDFPDAEGRPYKSSGGKMVYNETLKREIPEGWGDEKVESLGTITGGSTPPKEDESNFVSNGTPWITPKDLSLNIGNKFISRGNIDVTEKGLRAASLHLLPPRSVLMSSRAPVGYLAINRITCTTNQGFKSIICNKGYSCEYVFYLLHQYMPVIESNATGSTFKEISASVFKNINICKPKKKIIDAFTAMVKPIFEKQDKVEQQNQQLAALRDWLLPMLMNGQVQVGQEASSYTQDSRINIPSVQMAMVAEPAQAYDTGLSNQEKYAHRKALAVFIANTSLGDQNFGKTKFEKLLHLVEYHVVKKDYNQSFYVHAAGPYDGRFTKYFWEETAAAKWYSFEERGNLKQVKAAENHAESMQEQELLSDVLRAQIAALIGLFKNSNYEFPEIISTLYAVWNNRLIKKQEVNDALLKQDFLEWSTAKAQYEDQLDYALEWMRTHGIIPDGWGKEIKKSKKNQ